MDSEINDLEKFIILINQIEKSILDKYFWKWVLERDWR